MKKTSSSYNHDLREFLELKTDLYNRASFIESDPISIPHLFSKKEDIEISGFLTASIAWGRRKTIITNARKLVEWMDYSPADFILNHSPGELKPFRKFSHRTFNGTDCLFFIRSLQNIYKNKSGLETVFSKSVNLADQTVLRGLSGFRKTFFSLPHPARTRKHVSDPLENSAAKRINMFLRWMVRNDKRGVDFGIWKSIKPSQLCCPLDVHSGNVARKLGLLNRKQNDWKSVEELTGRLREFDPLDPVKYDFALFGLGVFEKIF